MLAGIVLAIGLIVVGVVAVEEANRTDRARFDVSAARPVTIDVRLPNGVILTNVPQGTTKQQLTKILEAHGYDAYENQPAGSAPTLNYKTFKIDRAQEAVGGGHEKDDFGVLVDRPAEKPKWSDAPIVKQQPATGPAYLAAVVANIPAWLLAGVAAAAAAIYALCRAIGWVLAGFLGD